MMINSNNRISALLDSAASSTTEVRTDAQRAASRTNGAKGRGPRTAEGKARSRLNSMRHGILARVICPPEDGRAQDRMFRFARSSLITELRPKSFTQFALIDSLAADYVALARARLFLELFQRPATLGGSDAAKWEKLQRAREDLKQLRAAAAWHSAGEGSPLAAAAANRVASHVAAILNDVVADVASADEEEQERSRHDDAAAAGAGNSLPSLAQMERDEMRPLRKLVKTLGPATTRFTDADYLASLLSGSAKPVRGDGKRLTALLAYAVQVTSTWINGQRELARRMEAVAETKVAAMAQSKGQMEQLLLLDRYRARIEAAIERKLQRFADR